MFDSSFLTHSPRRRRCLFGGSFGPFSQKTAFIWWLFVRSLRRRLISGGCLIRSLKRWSHYCKSGASQRFSAIINSSMAYRQNGLFTIRRRCDCLLWAHTTIRYSMLRRRCTGRPSPARGTQDGRGKDRPSSTDGASPANQIIVCYS